MQNLLAGQGGSGYNHWVPSEEDQAKFRCAPSSSLILAIIFTKFCSDKKFNVIQCTGYLKSWSPAMMGVEEQEDADSDSSNMSCLVAIGRILPHISTVALTRHSDKAQRPIQFVSRHALDGKFIFIDQRWVRTCDKYIY